MTHAAEGGAPQHNKFLGEAHAGGSGFGSTEGTPQTHMMAVRPSVRRRNVRATRASAQAPSSVAESPESPSPPSRRVPRVIHNADDGHSEHKIQLCPPLPQHATHQVIARAKRGHPTSPDAFRQRQRSGSLTHPTNSPKPARARAKRGPPDSRAQAQSPSEARAPPTSPLSPSDVEREGPLRPALSHQAM